MKALGRSPRLAACVSLAIAVPAAGVAADRPLPGDAARGAALSTTCQACHGAQGEGNPASGFPRLAGQTADYLAAQLRNYADGRRASPVMAPVAKALDAQKRADVAAFYAARSAPYAAPSAHPASDQLLRGRLLTRVGDESKQLQACANCHGPDGSGERYAAPYLAGQSATYLANAIGEWRTGTRHSGEKQMGPVVARLDDQDVAALSAYLESLGAARPASSSPSGAEHFK
jgi:cytochrome c553